MKSITNKKGKKQQKANARKHKLANQANDDQPTAENKVEIVKQKPAEAEDGGTNTRNNKGGGNHYMEVYIFQIRG
jgi:hypothetical protein